MAEKEYTKIELIEKIVAARLTLERTAKTMSCTCMVDLDPDYRGPCTCKNRDVRNWVDIAISTLKL